MIVRRNSYLIYFLPVGFIVLLFVILRKGSQQTQLYVVSQLPYDLVLTITPNAIFTADLSKPGKFRIYQCTSSSHLQLLASLQGNVAPIGASSERLYLIVYPTQPLTSPEAKVLGISLHDGSCQTLIAHLTPISSASNETLYPVTVDSHSIYWLAPTYPNQRYRSNLMQKSLADLGMCQPLLKNCQFARQIFLLPESIGLLKELPPHHYRTVIRRAPRKVPIFHDILLLYNSRGQLATQIDDYNSHNPPVQYHDGIFWVQDVFAPNNNSDFPDHYRIMCYHLLKNRLETVQEFPTFGNPPPQFYVHHNHLYMAQASIYGFIKIWRLVEPQRYFQLLFEKQIPTTGQLIFQDHYCYFVARTYRTSWLNWSHAGLAGQPIYILYRFPLR